MKLSCETLKSELQLYRVLLKLFKMLGLAPFNMNLIPSTQNKEDQFDINYTYSFEESAYDFILSVCLFFKIVYDLLHEHFEKSYQHMYHIINNLSLMIIYTSYCLMQQLSAKIITNLTYLESELTCRSWDYSFKLTSIKKYLLILIIFFTINFSLIIIFHTLWSASQTIETFFTISSLFIIEVFIIQYAFVIIYLYERLKILNRSLWTIVNNNVNSDYIGMWTSSLRNNVTNQKLVFLRQAHRLLYNCLCDATKFYSVPIFFAVLSNFPVLFLSVESLIAKAPLTEELYTTILRRFGVSFLILFSLVPIFVLCFFVTKIITEMKCTVGNLNKIMAVRSSDDLIKEELEGFFIELLHRNHNITACGFFKIDNSLLSLIFTGILIHCFSINLVLIDEKQENNEDNNNFLLSSFISII